MIRKTTPTHIWTLSIPVEMILKIEAYYSQNGNLILKKKTDDFTLADGTASVTLTSEDTLLFDSSCLVDIQLMVETISGEICGTKPIQKRCYECLCDEAIE